MRKLSALVLMICASRCAMGRETFSYLYIQGDKQTPFYVKLEDAMQPRFGKNYCVIPRLAPGPAHIKILFQQNAFPEQDFTVQIPESGSRGFLLVKKDTAFSLYDLQQGFYLAGGNNEADDHLPDGRIAGVAESANPELSRPVPEKNFPVTDAPSQPVTPKVQPIVSDTTVATASSSQSLAANSGPAFIPGIELSNTDHGAGSDASVKTATPVAAAPAITNSDCPKAISTEDFGTIFNTVSAFGSDEERLEYLEGKMGNCYASWQARTLAGRLGGDAARFSLLRKIYPRITDQGAFPLLDDLLTTDTWKAAFAKLLHH